MAENGMISLVFGGDRPVDMEFYPVLSGLGGERDGGHLHVVALQTSVLQKSGGPGAEPLREGQGYGWSSESLVVLVKSRLR